MNNTIDSLPDTNIRSYSYVIKADNLDSLVNRIFEASDINTSNSRLYELAKDDSWRVRYMISIRENLPEYITLLLSKDDNLDVSLAAIK